MRNIQQATMTLCQIGDIDVSIGRFANSCVQTEIHGQMGS